MSTNKNKRSEKAFHAKARNTWTRKSQTQIIASRKVYNRKSEKNRLRQTLGRDDDGSLFFIYLGLLYFFIIIAVIIIGLSTRYFPSVMPRWVVLYAGDVLWGSMVYFMFRILLLNRPTYYGVISAIIFSFLIETSQLYSAPWIDTLRHTVIGGLILGFGFLWSDLLCYTVGITLAYSLDKIWFCQMFYKKQKVWDSPSLL